MARSFSYPSKPRNTDHTPRSAILLIPFSEELSFSYDTIAQLSLFFSSCVLAFRVDEEGGGPS